MAANRNHFEIAKRSDLVHPRCHHDQAKPPQGLRRFALTIWNRWQQNRAHQDPCRQQCAQNHPVGPQRDVWSARSGIDVWCARSGANCSKTEPMKTDVANTGPRIIALSPNGMFGVPRLESIAAKQNPSRPTSPTLGPESSQ